LAEQPQLVTLGELDLPHLGHIHPTLFCLIAEQVHIFGGSVLDHVNGAYKYPPQFGHVGFAILDIINYLRPVLPNAPSPLSDCSSSGTTSKDIGITGSKNI
jgi:hypothetical protein